MRGLKKQRTRLSTVLYLLKEGTKNIWNNRSMSLASIGILISCLLLTGAAVLISFNVKDVIKSIGDKNVVYVYLDDDISTLEAISLGQEIKKIPNITDCSFYPKDEAIEQYRESLGEIFDEMTGKSNPLPNAYHISIEDLSKYDETVAKIQAVEGVNKTSNRREVAEKLTDLDRLATSAGIWIVIILGLISLFIISNTIRMTMYSRRFEISIMKSVGATDLFVRIPFVVEGMVIGFISGIIASFVLMFLYDGIMAAVNNIVKFNWISFGSLYWQILGVFVLAGVVVGVLGGFISIGKYLKKEGGEILGW